MTIVYADLNPELTRDRHAAKVMLAATLHHYDRVLLQGEPPLDFDTLPNDAKRFYLTLAADTLVRLAAAVRTRNVEPV